MNTTRISIDRRASVRRVARRLGAAGAAAGLVVLSTGTASADVSSQWPLQYLKAQQCWQISKGAGITVAVADTGVQALPNLSSALVPGADFGIGPTDAGNGETDGDGHGTEMATEIGANGGNGLMGLAPQAKILPVRVNLGSVGWPAENVSAGIHWAVAHGAKIINMSFGGAGDVSAEASAVQYALSHNVLLVAASGNTGNGQVGYPASYPGVLAVGAIQQNGAIWSNSNYGPTVGLAAPGVNIPTQDNTGTVGNGSGTSEASAYVSAAAALVWSAHPGWTAGQVIRDLINTADEPAGVTGRDAHYGYGVVDPLKALQASAPSQTTNPLVPTATPSSTPAASAKHNSGSSGGSNTGLIIGIVVAVVVVVAIIVVILIAAGRRKRRMLITPSQYGGPPPPPPGYGPPPGS